jgi:hypothetical protein
MIPTTNMAGQWAVVPLAGVQMDFEAWMASFKFDKVSCGGNYESDADTVINCYRTPIDQARAQPNLQPNLGRQEDLSNASCS